MGIVGSALHNASRPVRFGGRMTGRAAWGVTKASGRGVQRFPKIGMAAAALAGAGVVTAKTAASPDVQEAMTGSPTALQDTVGAWSSAVLFGGFNPNDRMDPYGAMRRGGDVVTTSNYLYGRPVQGQLLGDMRGSPVIGSYNMGAFGDIRAKAGNTYRMRGRGTSPTYSPKGSGRDPLVDGSLVFGQYNLRR